MPNKTVFVNKQWQLVKADGFEKICSSPWLCYPSCSTGYWQRKWFSFSSFFASLEKASSSWPSWLPQSQVRTDKAHMLTSFIPTLNCFCLTAKSKPITSHCYWLTSWVVTWQEQQKHFCLSWSQPGTGLVEFLVSLVQHCGCSPQIMTTLLLGVASEHVTPDISRDI